MSAAKCVCCGRNWPEPNSRIQLGPIHFDCWDDHHSDPTTEWPIGHVCHAESEVSA